MDDIERRMRRALDRGEARMFRLFWLFLPEPAIARSLRFQHIVASRFLSDAAQQSLAYGAIVAVVRGGGSAFDAALVGIAGVIPPALLGLYGGMVADAVPKRLALGVGYLLQAVLCFTIPVAFGTDLPAMIALLLAVGAFAQVTSAAESSVVPLVASNEELASANSMLSLSSAAGTAIGTAVLAPILVRVFGVQPVIVIAGVLLLLASSRVLHLQTSQDFQKLEWKYPHVHVGDSIAWLFEHPAVATMILVAVLAGTASTVLQTLAPRYVQSVLHVDATNAVYVFAPSAAGMLTALAVIPLLMRRIGERVCALAGFFIVAVSIVLFGLVDDVAPVIDLVNPLRLVTLTDLELSRSLRTAAFFAVPLGFGTTLTANAVQTYINRRVPLSYQGRTFAMQTTLKNAASIAPLLTFGAIASTVGVEPVLLAAPFLLLVVAYAMILFTFRLTGRPVPSSGDVLSSFWDEPAATGPPAPS